jgi:epoxyqueuosine reductase
VATEREARDIEQSARASAERAATAEDAGNVKDRIRAWAAELGFDAVGFAAPDLDPRTQEAYRGFLVRGEHGDMGWLAANAERREAPRALWPGVRSVVVLGANYGPEADPLAGLAQHDRGNISVYARNRDYHDVVKKRLKQLAGFIHREFATEVKVFVDTAPVLEKPLAQRAGIGWQGKHTNLLSRPLGSWLFLGEVFTALDLPPDPPERDHCGSCRRCLDACPTGAFPAPYRLDARRCISYLTIEHKGPIPREFRGAIGNRIYGCDDCLAVCPWNKFARASQEMAFAPRGELVAPRLAELAALDDGAFRSLFSKSPVKRIGRDRFVRNVLIAIGNSGDPALRRSVEALLDDPSPLVRGAAVWALARLLDAPEFERLRDARAAAEPDPEVRDEWRAAGGSGLARCA